MKKILVLLFILIALCASADTNVIRESMLDTTVLLFKQANSMDIGAWIGSGVIVSPDGYIVTNRHVAGYHLVMVGEKYEIAGGGYKIHVYHRDWGHGGCRVVAVSRDPNRDLAILKIETIEDLPFAEIATIKNMLPGDTVYSVGHPHGVAWTITKGSITNFLELVDHTKWIMHDSSINPGNSGGPLFDEFGKIVGLNFSVIPPQYAENMGLAIDARMIAMFVEVAIKFDKMRMEAMSEDDFEETGGARYYYQGYYYKW